jgi:murein DD-endopeptidase MepM/ murein hydrolase activator NlpD
MDMGPKDKGKTGCLRIGCLAALGCAGLFIALTLFILLASLDGQGYRLGGGENLGCQTIPKPQLKILTKASQKWHVRVELLAAVGEVENNFISGDINRTSWAVSAAGAQGPFQFMPDTWKRYRQDAGGDTYADDSIGVPDGKENINSVWDAAFGAAEKLAKGGAGGNLTPKTEESRRKIIDTLFLYNRGKKGDGGDQDVSGTHDYVDKVLRLYAQYECEENLANIPIDGKVFPVAIGSLQDKGYTDDWLKPRKGHKHHGTDIFTKRCGAPVLAVTNGTIERFNNDSWGKKNYRFTINPRGFPKYYYTHIINPIIKAGDKVTAGQPLGEVGKAGGRCHLHFGIKVANGTPGSSFYSENWWINPISLLRRLDPRNR